MIDIYAYVNNTFQCFNNSDSNNKYFYGCLSAYYNKDTNTYECNKCIGNNFIHIKNEKICKKYYEVNLQSYCLEAENIGTEQTPIYSCINCPIYRTKVVRPGIITDCYAREYKYTFCLEGEIDENNIKKCTKCVPNSQFNSSEYCECDTYSFGNYNFWWCNKCDDKIYGNPGCEPSKGCIYYHRSYSQFNCGQCKNGYFSISNDQCYPCHLEIPYCKECHYNKGNSQLFCDKCDEGFIYNETEKRCVLNDCQEYPDISPGCIICKENFE